MEYSSRSDAVGIYPALDGPAGANCEAAKENHEADGFRNVLHSLEDVAGAVRLTWKRAPAAGTRWPGTSAQTTSFPPFVNTA